MSTRYRVATRGLAVIAVSLIWIGCKSDPAPMGGGGDGGGGGDDAGTADGPGPDGPAVPPGCNGPVAGAPQCSNCVDDDNDGYVDSFDVECTFPVDNVESSFATGIPGDSVDLIYQDCFFDGDSSLTNDGCSVHVCCLLGATSKAQCPIGASQYNPKSCPPPLGNTQLSQMCTSVCGPLTLPGCDCLGCCTLCDPATNDCVDVATNPITSPGCTLQQMSDPALCKRCTKLETCGKPTCGGTSCILCPGQAPSDLPPSCNGTPACPADTTSCANGETCAAGTYCHAGSGCCIRVIL
jgi:hypothetical protein